MLPELKYVEIIAATASGGADHDAQVEVSDGDKQELASTITVLAAPEQARLLAELEQAGQLHVALVFRGDSTQADRSLEEQQRVLEELYAEEDKEAGKETGAGEGVRKSPLWMMEKCGEGGAYYTEQSGTYSQRVEEE